MQKQLYAMHLDDSAEIGFKAWGEPSLSHKSSLNNSRPQDWDDSVCLLCSFFKYPGSAKCCWSVCVLVPVNMRCSLTGVCLICRCRMLVQNGWSTQAPPTSPTQSLGLGKVKTDSQLTVSSAGTDDNHYLISGAQKEGS